MKKRIISPSILSLDYSKVNEQLNELVESEAEWLHFDVMDGHFVPNLTFGPDILKGFKKATNMVMDVHLMVDNPRMFANVFGKAGADIITFHYEACKDIDDCVNLCREIRAMGLKCGVSVKPKTDVKVLFPILNEMDMVLIMSVEPGFGGQSFMHDSLDKVRLLKEKINEINLDIDIEIDGGINKETGQLSVDAGVNVLVAGSYIFKQDISEGVHSLICLK